MMIPRMEFTFRPQTTYNFAAYQLKKQGHVLFKGLQTSQVSSIAQVMINGALVYNLEPVLRWEENITSV